MSDETIELTIEELAATSESEFSGDVWELTVETGLRGPPGIGGEALVHEDLPGRNDPNQHSSDAITTAGAVSLTTRLLNTPKLDAANQFTASQLIDVPVPVTPVADIATEKPTIPVHIHGGDGAALDLFAVTITDGTNTFKTAGVLTSVIGLDGDPTGEWVMLAVGSTGPGFLRVTSTDTDLEQPPFTGDLLTAVPEPLTIGTGTDPSHGVTKAQMDLRIPNSLVDAKGDVLTATANDTPARLAVGSNDQVLTADSSAPTGLKWAAPPSSGIPATTIDAAGDLLVGTANDTAGRLAVGAKNKVLTSDGTTPQWSLASLWRLAPPKAAVGDWLTQPRASSAAGTQTLNRTVYVPFPIPGDWTAVDGIAAMPTTATTSALCRFGLYLPHATTGLPDALVIDAGQADYSSGGGASAVARTLTFTSIPVTPDSLIYVSITPQGATAPALMASLEWLRMFGYASSTVATAFANPAVSTYYTDSVSGALSTTPSITAGTNTVGQPVVALRRA